MLPDFRQKWWEFKDVQSGLCPGKAYEPTPMSAVMVFDCFCSLTTFESSIAFPALDHQCSLTAKELCCITSTFEQLESNNSNDCASTKVYWWEMDQRRDYLSYKGFGETSISGMPEFIMSMH